MALPGCGGGGSDSETTAVVAVSPADRKLAARVQSELALYEKGFDLELLPAAQQAQLAAIANNLPQAAGGVRTLRVSDGMVEADTDFAAGDESSATGRLICGAIERSLPKDAPSGSRVLGADDAVLAECAPDDASFP